jgi:glycerophosphoryl diester phosphodiesterase
LFAAIVGLPLLIASPVTRGFAFFLGVALLFLNAAGAHYHAVFERLPTRSTLGYLRELASLKSSITEHAPIANVVLEAIVPTYVCFASARAAAPRFASVFADATRQVIVPFVFAVSCLISLVRVGRTEGQEHYGVIGPLLNVTKPEPALPAIASASSNGEDEDVLLSVERALGTDNMGPPADARYPFCSTPVPSTAEANHKSAILLILESVDMRALSLQINGKPVMPNLQRLANDGVIFPRFFATGYQSAHAMPALFGGIPAVPLRAILQHAPLEQVRGFPSILRDAGYETAYFHGSDLSFEQQRQFLDRAGFHRIVEPSPLSDVPRYGWGISDGALFDQIRAFVEEERRTRPEESYFASAFTVTTHDPYVLPPDHRRRFNGDSEFYKFAESLAYLDDEIGRFYDWFKENETPHGTLLFVTGDHAPRVPLPGDPTDTSTGEFEYRFRVPFLAVGFRGLTRGRAQTNAVRMDAGHEDFPATILDALGLPSLPCQMGRSLVGRDPSPERIIPSVAGESLQFLYAHQGSRRFMTELGKNRVAEYDYEQDPAFRNDLAPRDPRTPEIARFFQSYLAVMRYAVEQDRFSPPVTPPRPVTPLPTVKTPRFAAHRALTRGAKSPPPNSAAAIEQAVKDGAEWAEIDLNTTLDRVPVVFHDPELVLPDGTKVPVYSVTLDALRKLPGGEQIPTLEEVLTRYADRIGFCLELKPEPLVADMLSLVRTTLQILDRIPKDRRIVIDSFDHMMLATVRQFSSWPTGYDFPQKQVKSEWLDFARDRGFDWVYIREQFVTPDVVREAHARGLQVMVYPPASPTELPGLDSERPDGVMTEDLAAFAPWRR